MSEAAGDEPNLARSLNLPPTADERLEALEAERDREQAAVRDLEQGLKEAAASRAVLDERGRYRRTVRLAFVLTLLGMVLFLFLTFAGVC